MTRSTSFFKIILILIIPLSLSISPRAAAEDKYIYFIIETDQENFVKDAAISFISSILDSDTTDNIDSIFIRNASDTGIFSKKNIIEKKYFSKLKFNTLKEMEPFNQKAPIVAGNVLSIVGSDIQAFGWEAEKTILVYIGDLVYQTHNYSSRGGYLGYGFINHQESPYKYFIDSSVNNKTLSGLKAAVFSTQNTPPLIYFKQRNFIAHLFHAANRGINLVYYGGLYNYIGDRSMHDQYAVDTMKNIIKGKFHKIIPKSTLDNKTVLPTIHFSNQEIHVSF